MIERKYDRVISEGMASNNNNTFLTYDTVIGFTARHLTSQIEKMLGIEIKSIEFADKENTYIGLHETNTDLLEKNLLPRAVVTMDLTPVDSELIQIESEKLHFGAVGRTTALESIYRASLEKDPLVPEWDYYRDISFMLRGKIRHTTMNVGFTVLLDNRIDSFELYKHLSIYFPVDKPYNIWKTATRIKDGEIKEDQILQNYTPKVHIPLPIIDYMKKNLGILDHKDSDNLLEKVLKANSAMGINREVNGSDKSVIWYTRFNSVPSILPSSIQRSDNVKDKITTAAVRIDFQLTYIDMPVIYIMAKYKVLNKEFYANLLKERDEALYATAKIPVNIARIADNVNGCERYETVTIEYIDSDIKDGKANVNLYDLLNGYNDILKSYMLYISESNYNDEECYTPIIKHANSQTEDKSIMSSIGIEYDFETFNITDSKSTSGNAVHIIIYVNMKRFKDWKAKTGYLDEDNLSAKILNT